MITVDYRWFDDRAVAEFVDGAFEGVTVDGLSLDEAATAVRLTVAGRDEVLVEFPPPGERIHPERGFTAVEVCRYGGATPSQVRYWRRIRLVVPSIQQTGGRPGRRALYSWADIEKVRRIVRKLWDGVSIQEQRRWV